jgi:hypothetical protein
MAVTVMVDEPQCRLVSRVWQVPPGEVVVIVLSLVFHGE